MALTAAAAAAGAHAPLRLERLAHFPPVHPRMHACSKAEVVNLLESAGFSRANPYYVVQQVGSCGCVCGEWVLACMRWARCCSVALT